jgi:inner membrane protein
LASAFSHPAAVVALSPWLDAGKFRRRELLLATIGSVLPDIDAIGYWLGVPYDSPFGHRGFTHSFFFAAVLAATFVWAFLPKQPALFVFLFLCIASHGVLDAMTGGGGGIAFLAPFVDTRYRFPYRPIRVSPIALGELGWKRGIGIVKSELLWIWLPSLALFAIGRFVRASKARDARAAQ